MALVGFGASPGSASTQPDPSPKRPTANCTVLGTPGDDTLQGTAHADVLCGLGGNDVINGGGGADVLRGGPGDDRLLGGDGADVLWGGLGVDHLRGATGRDGLHGGPGADWLRGGLGDDVLAGDAAASTIPGGRDHLRGGPGVDWLLGGDGADRLFGGTGPDLLWGDAGQDHLRGGTGSDSLHGGAGDDQLEARDGDGFVDRVSCGAGSQDVARADVQDSVSVDCETYLVDDPPTAVDDAATVTEDGPATAIDVLANDTDSDGGPKLVESVTQPDHGTVAITGGGTALTYAPDADYCNDGSPTDSFTYTLNGGSTATVSVSVTCVDDPPTAVDDAATVTEDGPATAIDVLANDTDVDGGPISVDSVTQPASGVVVITGGGTGLTYAPDPNYCNDPAGAPPGDAPDTFTYTLTPGGSTATVSVTVTCVDDPPTAVDDSASVAEDSGNTSIDVLANDTDIDGGPKLVESVTQPDHGTVAITGGGTALTYAPVPDYCNDGSPTDSFTYTLNGGSTATVSVSVTCVDDPPTAVDDAATVTEDGPATAIDVLANDADVDGGPISVDSVTQPANGAVVITGGGTGLTYAPDANYCNDGSPTDTFTYTLTPGGSTASVAVTVTCVNDAPVAVDDTGTTDEDTTLSVPASGVLGNDTDLDSGDTKTVVELNGSTTLTGTSAAGASVTIHADGSYTYDPGNVFQGLSTGQSDTDSFTYTMADSAGAESTATVHLTINGVSDAPVANADSFDAVGNTGLFVGTTRTAGQAGRQITGSVLANDTDPDSPNSELVAEPVTDATTTLGGTITINADGSFSYQPDVGDTGVTDTFTYRVCDTTPCDADTVTSSTGTLSLPIAGQVWYVGNTAAAGGNGSSDTPFDTLAEAQSASGASDTTFVFAGDGTSTGLSTGYAMDANERLIGEVAGLSLDPDGGGPLGTFDLYPATPGARPTLTASNADVVTLGTGATVQGVGIDPAGTGGGISGGSGVNGVTITDVTINDTGTAGTQPGLELDGTTGTTNISDLSVTTSGATGVRLNNAGTVAFAATGTVSITTSGARGLDATGTAMGGSTFDSITVTGSTAGGVGLTNTTGTTTFGDLALTTTGGTTPAFALSNAGTVTVTGAANTLTASTGTALNVTSTTIGANGLTFRSISAGTSSTGPTRGISLVNTGTSGGLTVTGTGTTAGSGGTIQHTTSSGTETFGAGDGGIYLNNTAGVSLANMNISANHASGIYGTGVTNLTLTGDSINANGTNNTNNDDGVRIDGLTGTGTIGTTSISGSAESDARIVSGTSGSLTMSVTGSTFSTAAKGFGLLVSPNGASVTTTATGNTFQQNFSDGLAVLTTTTGSGTITFTASNNTVTNNTGAGIDLGTGGGIAPPATFTISSNTVKGQQGSGINILNGGGGTWTGHVTSNTVGDPNVANSGSFAGWGVIVKQEGTGTLTADVSNNTIRQIQNFNGVEGSADTGTGTLNLTMTGNNIDTQQVTSQDGIFVNTGVLTTDTSTVCLNATGNISKSEGTASPPPAGNGLFDAAGLTVDNNNAGTTFKIVGLPPGIATDDTAVANYLASINTLSGPGGPAFAQHNASGTGFTSVANCPTAP